MNLYVSRRRRSLCKRFGHCHVILIQGIEWGTFFPVRTCRYWLCARCREHVEQPPRWQIHGRIDPSVKIPEAVNFIWKTVAEHMHVGE